MKFKRISVVESYNEYEYKDSLKSKYYVDKKDYKKIIFTFFKVLIEFAISTGLLVKFPSRLGALQMMQIKCKNPKIDFKKTEKYFGDHNKENPNNRKFVYYNNIITNGYIPIVHWYKKDYAFFKKKNTWALTLSRTNIRPNSYNKNNPTFSLYPFFQKKGYRFYKIYNPYENYKK